METGKLMRKTGIVLITILLAGGCTNIFDFASDAQKSPTERAEDAIRNGNYEAAREALTETSETDAYANYLNAKVALLEAGIDLATIVDLVEGQDDNSVNDNLALLDIIDDLSNQEKTAWYQGNLEATKYLRKIWLGQSNGIMSKDDIALDYTVSNMMSGVLGLRDTNRDGEITNNDFQLNLSLVKNATPAGDDGFDLSGGSFIDDAGDVIMFDGLEVFLGDWQPVVPKVASMAAGKRGYTPDDINALLAFVMSVLDDGADAIVYLIEQQTGSSFDPDESEDYIAEIGSIINYYWYNDGIDNDGDGRIDEETINGADDDGDGFIDEDSDYHPADPTPDEDTSYIPVWQAWNER